ncbi:ABC transporter permease [Actinomyces sp. 2119]|uniref:ABC transporter permease n=1 Tax=Actinomyces lilanjuaniae TaxID=2321394 RepID=A0ABN5PTF5_9ACTO|nr:MULTISPECIES: ABC transporter permease subunit [Actinomyces]AYD90382.1 ABC transporter permease [Actinomyces lilanjuaniae]RJF40964.1 ABC transporter permease [Actinomyces sp. 2119]
MTTPAASTAPTRAANAVSDAVPAPSTAPSARRPYRSRVTGRQTFARAVYAEWAKIRSLRSTWITSGLALFLTAFFGAAIAITYAAEEAYSDAIDSITGGIVFGQIVISVQAALTVTGEYASGQIRSSLAAVPHRGRLLAAKAVVVSALAFLLGLVSVLVAWGASAPFLGEHAGSLTDPEYLGYFWGTGLAFTGIALMSLGLGFLLRSTAGTITVAVVLLFILDLPLGLAAMRWDVAAEIDGLLPGNSATAVQDPFARTVDWASSGTSFFLEQWQAAAVFAAWAIVPVIIGWIVLSRRDA